MVSLPLAPIASASALPGVGGARRRRAGFTMVEVAIAAFLILVALAGLSASVVSSLRLGNANEERAAAAAAAREIAELLETVEFDEIFALFNDDATDGTTALGGVVEGSFAVEGLNPREDDADGRVGAILFPTVQSAKDGLMLREDVFLPALGMPRDLNGDGVVDSLNHENDYILLPVSIRVEWTGSAGDRALQLDLLLVD
jgi:hypothetical protein